MQLLRGCVSTVLTGPNNGNQVFHTEMVFQSASNEKKVSGSVMISKNRMRA